MIKKVIRIIKNNAVPRYARKLSSGLGKKNKVSNPMKIVIIIIMLLIFINYIPKNFIKACITNAGHTSDFNTPKTPIQNPVAVDI